MVPVLCIPPAWSQCRGCQRAAGTQESSGVPGVQDWPQHPHFHLMGESRARVARGKLLGYIMLFLIWIILPICTSWK